VYSDEAAAALYEALNPWGASDDFYLELVMDAASVLDVGCGTGALLRRAREEGHAGRLCGVDPDGASLAVARTRADVEWVRATAAAMAWGGEFDLTVMTGHAFQVLVTDQDVRDSLDAVARALRGGGRFAFETRNPAARAWEGWTQERGVTVTDPSGRTLRVWHRVESVVGDVVTLTETTSDSEGRALRVDRASLRFLHVDALTTLLAAAGLEVEARYGGWRREPFGPDSPEIITIARRPPARSPQAPRSTARGRPARGSGPPHG
jgi:SAM-dependent methyltransferase